MNSKNERLFYSITASSIDRYLTLNGWKRNGEFLNSQLMVYDYFEKNIRMAIPASENFEDFYINLKNTLSTIALVEKKTKEQVLKDISNLYLDRIEFRIISDFSNDGKLPLKYASDCLEGIKELVLYSACAEQNAQPICHKAGKLAKTYLDSFKLAQTEFGSFIINIDTKVVDDTAEQLVLENCSLEKPFEHKVVERIYTAFDQLDSVVNKKKTTIQITEDGYKTGLTANMCEALLKLKPESGDIEIDAKIHYSTVLNKKSEIKKITVKNNHFWAMDEIAKIYRDKTLCQDVTLTGIVKALSKQKNDEITERTIRLVTLFDGKWKTISIHLSEADYIIACDAHRDEQVIEVSGTLDMSHKIWELQNISELKIK